MNENKELMKQNNEFKELILEQKIITPVNNESFILELMKQVIQEKTPANELVAELIKQTMNSKSLCWSKTNIC